MMEKARGKNDTANTQKCLSSQHKDGYYLRKSLEDASLVMRSNDVGVCI